MQRAGATAVKRSAAQLSVKKAVTARTYSTYYPKVQQGSVALLPETIDVR